MLAAAAVVLALTVLAWAYGVYCYVQMVRHRQPGVPALSVVWPAERLTKQGLEFRRRALWSYAAFAVFALLLVMLGRVATR
jgi:predicted metal-binding membrane protein